MNFLKWDEQYSTDCDLKYPSESTRKNYKSCVRIFLLAFQQYREPKEIPTLEIKKWLLQSSPNTLKHRLCAIKSFYQLTVGMPVKLDKIPYPKKEKKLPRILNQEEIKSKILAIENLKHRAVLAIAYCCGLRVSEVINLLISDIDGKKHLVLIRQAKGKKDRYTKISESTLEILREYYKEFKPKNYLFNGQFSNKYSTRSCEEIYHKYIDAETSFHQLRHANITSQVEAGTNLLAIGVAVGHTNPRTTSAYYHVSPKFLSQIPTPI